MLALSGGVGGAKLAVGLQDTVPPGALTVVVNTADDFSFLGQRISPDIDSVVYALSGRNDEERGWGRRGETWRFMSAVQELGGETWFQLGDLDLAMHLLRTDWIDHGGRLSGFTKQVTEAYDIPSAVLPMTDDAVCTKIETDAGLLDFQDYFVRRRCGPVCRRIVIEGGDRAIPHPDFVAALQSPTLEAVVVCPSNPYLSLDPILALDGIADLLASCAAPVVAVSPLIAGKAVKGPAAKLMTELGVAPTSASIVRHFDGIIDGIVVDRADEAKPDLGLPILVTSTLMRDRADKARLAWETLDFARGLGQSGLAGGTQSV